LNSLQLRNFSYIIEINAVCYIGPSTTLNVNSSCGLVEIYAYAHLTVEGDVMIQNGYSSNFFIFSFDDVTFTGYFINNGSSYNGFYSDSNLAFTGNLVVNGTGRTNFELCTFISPSIEISYPEFPQFGNKISILHNSIDVTNTFFLIGWSNGYTPLIGQNIGTIDISGNSGSISGFNSSNFTIEPIAGLNFTPVISSDNKSIYIQVTSALPIGYLNQPTVKLQMKLSQITWSVATQINNDKYIIEHNIEGGNFSPIGEIEGDGTSNITKHYEYIHTSPSLGINYYRIKQVDYDGKYSYSDIASVRFDGAGEISIYPNPATLEVTITTTASTPLQIMDVYGKVLSKQDISEGQNTINPAELPSGILIFVVGDQRFKVLKE
jgi:Secretion system C-terminal sorting domain